MIQWKYHTVIVDHLKPCIYLVNFLLIFVVSFFLCVCWLVLWKETLRLKCSDNRKKKYKSRNDLSSLKLHWMTWFRIYTDSSCFNGHWLISKCPAILLKLNTISCSCTSTQIEVSYVLYYGTLEIEHSSLCYAYVYACIVCVRMENTNVKLLTKWNRQVQKPSPCFFFQFT